jgi:superfamily I DNA/RNA helicase
MKSWDDVALLFRASSGFAIYESVFEKSGIPFVTVSGKGFYDRPEIRDILNMLSAAANPADDSHWQVCSSVRFFTCQKMAFFNCVGQIL